MGLGMVKPEVKNKALAKAISVLECFTVDNPELGITEICNMLSLNKSNVHDIVTTFEAHGYLKQNPSSSKYHLHVGVLRLAGIMNRTRPQREAISNLVRHLATETGETVYYGIRSGHSILYLDYMSDAHMIVPKQVVGFTAPLHCTSTGKALLAVMSEEEIDEVIAEGLEKKTEHTITDPVALKEDLAEIRRRGYSIDNMEHEYGIKGVGMTVSDMTHKAVAAISVSGPSLRFDDEAIKRIAGIINKNRSTIAITYF